MMTDLREIQKAGNVPEADAPAVDVQRKQALQPVTLNLNDVLRAEKMLRRLVGDDIRFRGDQGTGAASRQGGPNRSNRF